MIVPAAKLRECGAAVGFHHVLQDAIDRGKELVELAAAPAVRPPVETIDETAKPRRRGLLHRRRKETDAVVLGDREDAQVRRFEPMERRGRVFEQLVEPEDVVELHGRVHAYASAAVEEIGIGIERLQIRVDDVPMRRVADERVYVAETVNARCHAYLPEPGPKLVDA